MDKATDWRDDHRARTLHLLRKEIDAPKASHKKTPPKRGLVVEKTGDTQVAIRLDRAKRSKGSKGSDQWMPAINSCSTAQRWDRLIEKYELEANNIGISPRVEACQQITKRQDFSF